MSVTSRSNKNTGRPKKKRNNSFQQLPAVDGSVSKKNRRSSKRQISRRAERRVPNPPPIPTTCSYCGHDVVLKRRKKYECTNKDCRARVGVYEKTRIPLGPLANEELRRARQRGHGIFNAILRTKEFATDGDAYDWLAEQMGLPSDSCNWGRFDIAECVRAENICQQKLREVKGRTDNNSIFLPVSYY